MWEPSLAWVMMNQVIGCRVTLYAAGSLLHTFLPFLKCGTSSY